MIQHHGFREAIQTELRRVVSGATGKRVPCGKAADVDYRPASSSLQAGDTFFAAVEHSAQVGVQGDSPIFKIQQQFITNQELTPSPWL